MDASQWDARYTESELVWSAEPNRFVAEIIGSWPAGRALDLACGEGRNAVWLAGLGWSVTGVDFSPVAIDKAGRVAEANGVVIDWVCADATTYQHPSADADLVLVCYLQLPHDQLVAALTTATAALAPEGAVVVIAHALENLEDGYGGPQDPAVLPTVDQVISALPDLAVERAGLVTRTVTTHAGPCDAIDLVVVARRQS